MSRSRHREQLYRKDSRREHDGDRFDERERGAFLKKWTGRLPVALLYPNTYRVGMSSLGLQLVYRLLNDDDRIVCERFFLPEASHPLVSVESGRPLDNFPLVFFSVSFEHDYVNLPGMLIAAGIEPLAQKRGERVSAGAPLLVCGGVATFMNPEPLAPFIDLFAIGEAEALLPHLLAVLTRTDSGRHELCQELNTRYPGFYAPRLYQPQFDEDRHQSGLIPDPGLPQRVRRAYLETTSQAGHSELLTSQTEFAELFLTELGRGCSRGCRFCTAGFIYRPPRLWESGAVLASLRQRPEGVSRIGLVGMEMTDAETLDAVAACVSELGCSLSFSSLRADRISDRLVELLGASNLKSVAIAPDGGSQRLRSVINKGLDDAHLIGAAERLAAAGLTRLKLYVMIGLPSETEDDLQEFVGLLDRIRAAIEPIGRRRKRLCELTVSVNCFVPKPWTPFQYHPFGSSEQLAAEQTIAGRQAVTLLRGRMMLLKRAVAERPNIRITFDTPEQALGQAVLARGDRRLAQVLLSMATSGISMKQAMKEQSLDERLFATRQYGPDSFLPWQCLDHGIADSYLWREYQRAFLARPTAPCEPTRCRRCGVCHD
ncbi:radical SAM protein [Desulfofustis limnaeus]|uniref:Radical SAM protein n=1 Tax=Desulfofustis limnaeus TaxID=2740163 RepID=A0ABN6M5I9_9BACT|nr:radical SAM protein [Desulfofustis limnaeus]MDX9893917.1 radical SAM protein [Desulfofustis sp.]BDD86367.1 radical SAM protein [Desulfofustis limnaeus]